MFRILYFGPEEDHAINDGDVTPVQFENRYGQVVESKDSPPQRSSGEATTKSGRLIKFQRGADCPYPYAMVTAEEGAQMVEQSTLYGWPIGGAPPAKPPAKGAKKED